MESELIMLIEDGGGGYISVQKDKTTAGTLRSQTHGHPTLAVLENQHNECFIKYETAYTLNTLGGKPGNGYPRV